MISFCTISRLSSRSRGSRPARREPARHVGPWNGVRAADRYPPKRRLVRDGSEFRPALGNARQPSPACAAVRSGDSCDGGKASRNAIRPEASIPGNRGVGLLSPILLSGSALNRGVPGALDSPRESRHRRYLAGGQVVSTCLNDFTSRRVSDLFCVAGVGGAVAWPSFRGASTPVTATVWPTCCSSFAASVPMS